MMQTPPWCPGDRVMKTDYGIDASPHRRISITFYSVIAWIVKYCWPSPRAIVAWTENLVCSSLRGPSLLDRPIGNRDLVRLESRPDHLRELG